MKSRLITLIASSALLLGIAVLPGSPVDAAITSPVFATYADTTSGTLGDPITDPSVIGFAYLGFGWPPSFNNLGGSDFVPGGGLELTLSEDVATGSPLFSFTFDSSITELAVYFDGLRPTSANGPSTWTISSPDTVGCIINSGLVGATLVGNTLTPDATSYVDGVVLCSGSFSEITFTKNGSNYGADFVTIAIDQSELAPTTTTTTTVPEPTTTTTAGGDPVTPAYTG